MNEQLRLQVFLSRCGIGSRRYCEKLIQEGRVAVNGETSTRMGMKVTLSDRVTLEGKRVSPTRSTLTLAVHKPRQYLCAASDPRNRALVSDLFRSRYPIRLFHVGRLDYQSSGLILYTNDGDLARIIMHPSSGVEKEYQVTTQDPIPEEVLKEYKKGIRIEGELYRLKRYKLLGEKKVALTLIEGKNREIRRVFESRSLRIRRVHRLRIGCVSLTGIPPGAFRPLRAEEVRWFQRANRG